MLLLAEFCEGQGRESHGQALFGIPGVLGDDLSEVEKVVWKAVDELEDFTGEWVSIFFECCDLVG